MKIAPDLEGIRGFLEKTFGQRNDPRPIRSGVISFPWVQSLGNLAFCWIGRIFGVGWNPFRSIHVLQLTIAIGIYVKRKMGKIRPAGVITIFGITFFVRQEYHGARAFSRREIPQITSVKMV